MLPVSGGPLLETIRSATVSQLHHLFIQDRKNTRNGGWRIFTASTRTGERPYLPIQPLYMMVTLETGGVNRLPCIGTGETLETLELGIYYRLV
jgi:hypothetical protein